MNRHLSRIADHLPFTWVDGPGNRIVFFFQGCNFDCTACHNPQTIPLESVHAREWSVDDLLHRVRESMPYITGITVSGGEATVQHEFLVELFTRIHNDEEFAHLTTFIDSNGFVTRDDTLHRELTGQSNELVLESIRYLASIGQLYETRLMLVPGVNDAPEQLAETGAWLVAVDPEMRVKINHFHAHGARAAARDWAEADEVRKDQNRAALLGAGVRNLC